MPTHPTSRATSATAPPTTAPHATQPSAGVASSRGRLRLVALASIALVSILYALHRAHFDWTTFFAQLHHVAWSHVVVGVALIYSTYWLRAWRWAELCRPQRRVRIHEVLGPQFVGFTAVALFGRLADLARPYIIARRTGLPVASQVAVYTVERIFDLGAAAVVFSAALAFTPAGLPHREGLVQVGIGSLAATLVLAAFATAIRLRGEHIAGLIGRLLTRLSPKLATGVVPAVQHKILGFRDGLRAISSARDFLTAAALSLAMWGLIGCVYWQTTHAFAQTPELAHLSFSRTMLLMAASLGGSLLQLPGLGWFTQIAATAAAMHGFYGAPIEASTACGALLLLISSLSIVPAGLLFARAQGLSLRQAATTSEAEPRAEAVPAP